MTEPGSDLERRIGELTPDKLALLLKRLDRGAAAPPRAVIPRRPRSSFAVPSFAQQRLWFLQQMQPELVSYNCHVARRVLGDLDPRVLRQTMAALAERHESLRTTFALREGELVQVISPRCDLQVPLLDLSGLTEERRMAEVARVGVAEQERPFDLAHGPLVRTLLLRLGGQDHVVLLTMHHIVSDAWSLWILVRELGTFYPALAAGEAPPLPPLPIQYADFAAWERETLTGPALAERLDWWACHLAGAPAALRLPLDRPRSAARGHRAAHHQLLLEHDLPPALEALTRREDATPFVTMLAAFVALLGWWSGDEDVVVGSPIANRNLAETEGLIGFFINILALRARLHGDPTFVELLRQLRAASYGAFDRRDLPFQKLIEVLQPARVADRAPVFQVTFTLQNTPSAALRVPGLVVREFAAGPTTAKYDLALDVWQARGSLAACFTYDQDLFHAATIERLCRSYQALLREVAARPEARLSQLSALLDGGDREMRGEQARAWKQSRSEKLRAAFRRGSGG